MHTGHTSQELRLYRPFQLHRPVQSPHGSPTLTHPLLARRCWQYWPRVRGMPPSPCCKRAQRVLTRSCSLMRSRKPLVCAPANKPNGRGLGKWGILSEHTRSRNAQDLPALNATVEKTNGQRVATQPNTLKNPTNNYRNMRDRGQHRAWTPCEAICPGKDTQ